MTQRYSEQELRDYILFLFNIHCQYIQLVLK